MQDVIFIAILTAFFALSVVFVKACELIIGPDVEAEPRGIRWHRRGRRTGRGMTGIESVIGLSLSVLAAAYLVYTLVFPEKL